VLAIVIVLIVVLAGGGGGDNGQDCKPLDASQAQQGSVARVDLKAIGPTATEDCAPVGQVNVVPIPAQQQQGQRNQSQTGGFALATDATHLQPTENGDVYLLWLYKSDDEAAPLGQQTVNDSGNLSGATGVPVQGLLYLQQFPSIRVSRVTQAQAQQLTQAIRSRGRKATSAPFVGTPVLEGSATALLQQMIQRAQAQRGASGKSQ
jgi:hypothetical protein